MDTAPAAEIVVTKDAAAPEAAQAPAKAGSARKLIALGVLALVASGAVAYGLHARRFEDTDDAQIDGDISAVSPRVAGTIQEVLVKENQPVKAGDVLAVIDPTDFEVAVAQGKAAVAQAEAQLRAEEPAVAITQKQTSTLLATSGSDISTARADLTAAEHGVDQAKAMLEQSRANKKLAEIELERAQKLSETGAISRAELDQRSAVASAAQANANAAETAVSGASDRVAQARARLDAASSRAGEAKDVGPRQVEARQLNVSVRKATLELARAQLAQAELNLRYTKILAPVSGLVGKKSVSLGDRVQPGQQLLAITQTERLWVTANFRETQLKSIHTEQRVRVYVDAIDHELTGVVDSIGGATGARYSLLPPENAVGNYVKVVQRVPVRIRLDEGQADLDRLRPGLSVEPKVEVR